MPFIIPPQLLDVPAIVRTAAHRSGSPLPAIRRPAGLPPRVERPAAGGQNPDLIGPPLPPPPAGRVERPAADGQNPNLIGPPPAAAPAGTPKSP